MFAKGPLGRYGGDMSALVELYARPLFGRGPLQADAAFGGLTRVALSPKSWVDQQPGWLEGSEELFETLVSQVPWAQHRRTMYERVVDEPRMTAWYPAGLAWPHPYLTEAAQLLSRRYRQSLHCLSLNLYRGGADSVAWHGDRVARQMPEPTVAIVSLGAARPFLLRPKGGGRSRSFPAGGGDLLVMGGRCQQEFDHSVPKQARASPRLSVMFRPHDDRASSAKI